MVLNRWYTKLWCRNTSNRPPLGEQGAAILIANHTSPLDPALLQAGTDRVIGFLMARELFEVRSLNWLYRRLGCIPVNRTGRDTAAAKAALRALARGDVLGIFPEGKMNLNGKGLLDPLLGAALLALKSRAPVIPAYISGAVPGPSVVRPFFQRCRTRVRFGPPIDLSAYYGRERDRQVLAEVGRLFMSAVAQLGGVEGREPAKPGRSSAAA
jgi:1-acyl-sn-glycerol-3-phosphate acyltransferase